MRARSGGNANRENIQAVVQVIAEPFPRHHLHEISICRSYKPYVHLMSTAAAQALKLLLLQNP